MLKIIEDSHIDLRFVFLVIVALLEFQVLVPVLVRLVGVG